MAIENHPAILTNDAVRKELLEKLSKKELIEEVEFMKRQREEVLKELQIKNSSATRLESELKKLEEELKGLEPYRNERKSELQALLEANNYCDNCNAKLLKTPHGGGGIIAELNDNLDGVDSSGKDLPDSKFPGKSKYYINRQKKENK